MLTGAGGNFAAAVCAMAAHPNPASHAAQIRRRRFNGYSFRRAPALVLSLTSRGPLRSILVLRMSFFSKQFIDVIQWTEADDGTLAYRYPMEDMEIQNGGQLTVRESQMAVFVNEGQIADVFGPGLHRLATNTLPILTYLMNWDKAFKSPFKSDVYYFSTRLQTNQKWGTSTPITIRDKEFGAVRIRAYGIYAYHIADPKVFYQKVSGTRALYSVSDLDGQLRNTIVGRMTDAFGN